MAAAIGVPMAETALAMNRMDSPEESPSIPTTLPVIGAAYIFNFVNHDSPREKIQDVPMHSKFRT